MNEQKRMILFIACVFIAMFAINKLMPNKQAAEENTPNKPVAQTQQIETQQTKPTNAQTIASEAEIKVTDIVNEAAQEVAEAIPALPDMSKELIELDTDKYHITLSNAGGVIEQIELKDYSSEKTGISNIIEETSTGNYPLLIQNTPVSTLPYTIDKAGNSINVTFTYPTLGIKKTISISKDDYLMEVYFNGNPSTIKTVEMLLSAPLASDTGSSKSKRSMGGLGGIAQIGGKLKKVKSIDADETETLYSEKGSIKWMGIQSKYFMMVAKNQDLFEKGYIRPYSAEGEKPQPAAYLKFDTLPTKENPLKIFAGPKDYELLKTYEWGLEKVIFDSMLGAWFRGICLLLYKGVNLLNAVVHNYGVAILILTLIVKILLFPLTYKSMKSMSKMQLLQPKINELKEKYSKDPKKQQVEMMKLWKTYNVNPMGGCLPMLLQMPLFIALYRVFGESIMFRGAGFMLWITDLSQPDTIFPHIVLPFLGAIHILPVLNGITMFIQQKLSVKDPQQKAMVTFMPIFITFILYSLPSGLLVYWTFSNITSIIQQKIINAKIVHENVDLHKDLKEL